MSLVELLIFMIMIALGLAGAKVAYPIGGLWLAVPGFVFGFLIIPAAMLAHERYREWAYLGDQWMPDCLCGLAEFKYEKVGEELHMLCRHCLRRFEKRGDQVFIYENDQMRPYKRLVKYQGWV